MSMGASDGGACGVTESAADVCGGAERRAQPAGMSASEVDARAIWRAFVAGGWSLLGSHDHDGRRHLLLRRNPELHDLACLSSREREILRRACRGHANKAIAYELGLSPSTVASHLARARRKLGVTTRVALMKWASACVTADDD
jgi:DNA-binding CsgD family transcriptional regulator